MSPRTSSTPIADPGATWPAAGGPGLRPPPACSGTRPVGANASDSSRDRARREPRHRQRHRRAQQARLAGRHRRRGGRQAEPARQRRGSVATRRQRRVRYVAAAVDEPAAPAGRGDVGRRPAFGEDLLARAARPRALGEHGLDRRHAAERLLGEAPRVGDGAHQLAVDVDRAAAHAGDDSAVLDARVLGADQDDVLLGQEVSHHRDDADLERLRLAALEHGQRLADHAGLHGGKRHDRGGRAGGHDGAQARAAAAGGDRRCPRRPCEQKQDQRCESRETSTTHEALSVGGACGGVKPRPPGLLTTTGWARVAHRLDTDTRDCPSSDV